MTLEEKNLDKRVIRRNLERGRIDGPEYQRLLEALPDRSHNVQRTEALAPAVPEARSLEPSAPAEFPLGDPRG